METFWDWLKANWIFTVVLVPITIDSVKRLIKDWADSKKQRLAVQVDLSAGQALFHELTPQVDAALEEIAQYEEQSKSEAWLNSAERLFGALPSGFVLDDCYLDPKAILLSLSFEESRAVTLAVETWRRFKLHEIPYRVANDKFLVEITRVRALAATNESPIVRELISRMRGELTIMRKLISDYLGQSEEAVQVVLGELGSVDPRAEHLDSSTKGTLPGSTESK